MTYLTEDDIRHIVKQVIEEERAKGVGQGTTRTAPLTWAAGKGKEVPLEVSARHVHLTTEALEALFGKGYQLTHRKDLSQPGQFASNERVSIVTEKGQIDRVSVLGPVRQHVQVELSKTDAVSLGLSAPVRLSGDLAGAPDVKLVGPAGTYIAKESAIIAMAHVHMTPEDAARYRVRNGDIVSIAIDSERPVTLDRVIVRVDSPQKAALAVHIDFDEANAACASGKVRARLIKKL